MEKVFVYGTLKQGHHNNRALGNSRFVGNATLSGFAMYSLGAFPACCRDASAAPVHGEVYECNNAAMVRLDQLEGCPTLYVRQRFTLTDGTRAWVYFMGQKRFEGGHHARIANGVWPLIRDLQDLGTV